MTGRPNHEMILAGTFCRSSQDRWGSELKAWLPTTADRDGVPSRKLEQSSARQEAERGKTE
ncbi:MAG TPA: hypothetical protein EYQ63_06515 [Fuerstia sp.]|nr:hypothetical protein [Fuerstiella sp.]